MRPTPADASVLQTTATQNISPKTAGQAKVSSAFANLIQELAHEAALRSPVAAALPKTAPRTAQVQQVTAGAGEPTPELPAAQAGPAVPRTIELPPLSPLAPGEGRTAATKPTSVETTVESTLVEVAVKDGDKPPAPPPSISEGSRRQPKSEASRPQKDFTPMIDGTLFLPVVPPIGLKPQTFMTHVNEGTGDLNHLGGDDLRTTSAVNPSREQTLELRSAPALELKIRAQDQPTSEQQDPPAAARAPRPASTDQQTDTELPSTLTSGTQPRATEPIVHAFASAAAAAANEPAPPQLPTSPIAIPPVPVNPTPAISNNASSTPAPPPQAPAAHLAEEPVSRQPEQHAQPLRSLSLEFTPDGAQDVRVRLAERAGDVHISLHSTDPALSGRLSDGVHELVGTLANAGYEAQGWTQGHGRHNHSEQNQAPPDNPRKNRRDNSADPGTDHFGALMQQPIRIKP